ncbi:Protein translocase subunit SecY [ANME-1 cluster archaeon GoMg3.2]|nr:Protein translocase subunit SecY [ANME-1 cluster archaeon GoMg3.2]
MSVKAVRDALASLLANIPMVKRPKRHVPLKTKLVFTIAILVLYFALSNIPLFGLSPCSLDLFGRWQAIFAGQRFSLTALGVMPIIDAAIILQILAGPKIMKLDLTTQKDRTFYLNMQKLLVLCFAVLISFTYVTGFYLPDQGIASQLGVPLPVISFLLFLQVFLVGMLIYYMAEVISRWGIGSGVGLFIIASVTQQLISGLISWVPDKSGFAVGVIPRGIEIVQQVPAYEIWEGGIVFLFQQHLIALITTIALFFLLIYLWSARVELKIPGLYSGRRHGRIQFSIKFVHFTYAMIIPAVLLNLGGLLLTSIQGIGRMLYSQGITVLGTYEGNNAVSGLMYYISPIYSPWDWYPALVLPGIEGWQIAVRVAIEMSIMVAGAMITALLWLKLTPGLENRDIRIMIRKSGRQIYRYNRSIKAIRRAVDKRILKIAMFGSAVLGALIVIADMFGTLGGVSAAYFILAVSIVYGLYEEMSSTLTNRQKGTTRFHEINTEEIEI